MALAAAVPDADTLDVSDQSTALLTPNPPSKLRPTRSVVPTSILLHKFPWPSFRPPCISYPCSTPLRRATTPSPSLELTTIWSASARPYSPSYTPFYLAPTQAARSELILTDVAYKRLLGKNMGFDCMIGAYKSYDPRIKDNVTDGLCKKMEREWTTWLAT